MKKGKSSITTQEEIKILKIIPKTNKRLYWNAVKLGKALGYKDSQEFIEKVIKKIITISDINKLEPSMNQEFGKVKIQGKTNYELTRFGTLLAIMNSNNAKPETRKMKIILAKLTDNLLLLEQLGKDEERTHLSEAEKEIARIILNNGLSEKHIGIFKNIGYKNMYNMSLKSLKEYRNIPDKESIYDHMGLTEMAANTFRITQTAERIKKKKPSSEVEIFAIAKIVGKQIREIFIENTSIEPENIHLRSASCKKIIDTKEKKKHPKREDDLSKKHGNITQRIKNNIDTKKI